jgi:hypothetical protein
MNLELSAAELSVLETVISNRRFELAQQLQDGYWLGGAEEKMRAHLTQLRALTVKLARARNRVETRA